jgi:hypothetical protein
VGVILQDFVYELAELWSRGLYTEEREFSEWIDLGGEA